MFCIYNNKVINRKLPIVLWLQRCLFRVQRFKFWIIRMRCEFSFFCFVSMKIVSKRMFRGCSKRRRKKNRQIGDGANCSALGANVSIDSQIWCIYDVCSISKLMCIFIYVHPYYAMDWNGTPMMATIIFFYICLCPNRFCHNFTISLWANTFYATYNGFHSIVMLEQWIVHKTEDVRSIVMCLDLFPLSGLVCLHALLGSISTFSFGTKSCKCLFA